MAVPIDELGGIVAAAQEFLVRKGYPSAAPYRFMNANEQWEIGIVLVSNQLPHSLSGDARLFRQTKNAVALQVFRRASFTGRETRPYISRHQNHVW